MEFTDEKTIHIDRELSELDEFAVDFTTILRQHMEYVIVSGYVAILLGRARASEDVDVIIPNISFSNFKHLYDDLKKNDFYCLNAEEESTVYEYLKDDLAVRFAKTDSVIPNVEMKWIKNKVDQIAFDHMITVNIHGEELCVSQLELQIAFKEENLQSPKDVEDAEHIRSVAKEYLDEGLIQKYKEMLHGFY